MHGTFQGKVSQASDRPTAFSGKTPLACHMPASYDTEVASSAHVVRSEERGTEAVLATSELRLAYRLSLWPLNQEWEVRNTRNWRLV
jgi:hypothetical protein